MREKIQGANFDWQIADQASSVDLQALEQFGQVLSQLLFNRGIKDEKSAHKFLQPKFSEDFIDPQLFSDVPKVLIRIFQAKENKEKVLIYGDYDADGISGSSILARTFRRLGIDFEVYLPDRETEGYGLNEVAVRGFATNDFKLIITVDCGISNAPEIALANSLGLEVIVTDHHGIPKKLPEAYGIIHPLVDQNYPFKFLAGGGVAFKLAWALLHDSHSGLTPKDAEGQAKWLLDLVAISTVADMVPLVGENRLLVKYGLQVLAKTKNLGLKNLISVAQINPQKLDTYSIGFQIAPRINAAGRMDHASVAYDLLVTENPEEALWGANNLQQVNQDRQKQIEKIVTEALLLAEKENEASAIILLGEAWPTGLIGLVASKVIEIYNRPTIIASRHGGQVVASGRSIPDFDLIAALQKIDQYFIKYGGHKAAAGFSATQENFIKFSDEFKSMVRKALPQGASQKVLKPEVELTLADLNQKLVENIEKLAPFGEANPKPLFLLNEVVVTSSQAVGQDNKHWKLEVEQAGVKQKVMAFNFTTRLRDLKVGQKISLVCSLGLNTWQGKSELQVSLVDYKILS